MISDNGGLEVKQIDQNTCLSKGYKFNQFKVYAIEKNYFESTKTEDINFESVWVSAANIDIEPYGGYVDDSNPLTELEVIYTIKEIKNGKLVLEEVSSNQTPSKPTVKNQNIFEIIACFFKSIFGMSC
ncbi:MAG: hypothetical protein WC462_05005 [archaeon]